MSKLEEEKSYGPIFVLLSVILMAVFIWLVVDESVISRPWKGYQKKFYSLEKEFLANKIAEEEAGFRKTDKFKEYQKLSGQLVSAEALLNSDDVQDRLDSLKSELVRVKKKELKPVTAKVIAARNKKLEVEFNYGHHPNEHAKYLKEIHELDSFIEKYSSKQSAIVKKKDGITQRISLITADVERYKSELKQYTKEVDSFKTRLESVKRKRPTLQVYQTHIVETNQADRCMSCHSGIDKSESVSDENPYKSHPDRDLYLKNHPTNIFGCVVCHEGQGRALTSVGEAHGEVEYWLTPLLRGEVAASSCTKCHGLHSKLEGADLLVKGKELFTELGCYRCHETKGFKDLEQKERTGPALNNIAFSTQPEWLIRWIQNPKQVRPDTNMPNFNFSREEAEYIASYLWQISGLASVKNKTEFSSEMIAEGKDLFASKGCYVCHRDGETGSKFAPNLFNIGEKLKYDYTVKWLLEPKKYQPQTVMPSFRLTEKEARAIAAYLSTLRIKSGSPVGNDILLSKDNAVKGEALIKRYGCFSCHDINGIEGVGRIGVELSKVGSKGIQFFDFGLFEHEILHEVGMKHAHTNVGLARRAWMSKKLESPRMFDKGRYKLPKDRLRMPNFELEEDEIEALVVFLSSLVEEEIPSKFVYEESEKEKNLNDGWKIVKKYNCIGCHQFSMDKIELKDGTVVEGLVKKEKKGKVYFQLWQESKDLKKAAGKTIRFKKVDIVKHELGIGGTVAPLLIENLVKNHGIPGKEAVNYIPPKLYGQGKKTQPQWLFSFLKNPVILRPWYKAVMPTFNLSDEEIRKLVKYFSVRDNSTFPYEYVPEKDKRYIAQKEQEIPDYLNSAEALFQSATVNCVSCHIQGDLMPEGKPSDWAPDLSISKDRLRPSWIIDWLSDPQTVQPGTKMPTFFSTGMYQEFIKGSPEVQIKAVVDFLMNFTTKQTPGVVKLDSVFNNVN